MVYQLTDMNWLVLGGQWTKYFFLWPSQLLSWMINDSWLMIKCQLTVTIRANVEGAIDKAIMIKFANNNSRIVD